MHLESLEARTTFDVHLGALSAIDMMSGKDQLIPLQSTDDGGLDVTYTAGVTSAGNVVTASVLTGGRSWRLTVSGKDGNGDNFTGTLEFRLFEDDAPLATNRFITLTQQSPSFFNNIIFHRVIDGFMAQGGDPTGTGGGGSPLADFSDEFLLKNSFTSHGLLAMANSGDDTNDSQFFVVDTDITLNGMPQHLNYNHTILGILTKGQDVLAKIMGTPTTGDPPANPANKPLTNVTITNSEVFTDKTNGVLRVHAPDGFTGAVNVSVTAHNGQAGAGGTSTQNVNLSVSADVWNDRPFLGPLPDRTVLEDQAVTFDIVAFDDERDTINFLVGGEDITQLPSDNIEVDGFITPATTTTPTTATVTITPDGNFNGPVRVSFGIRDQVSHVPGNSQLELLDNYDSQTFTLTVIPVNDKPSFTASNPAAVNENSGAQSVPNWATFNAGATNEASQTATYTVVVNSGAALFSVAPAVSANGTLTYTLAPSASGTANISVTVKDNGGTSNGGIDTSTTQQFTLTVNDTGDAPTAVNDVALTKTGVTIPLTVLANDTHTANLNFSTLTITQAPSNGNAVVNTANGTIDYTPPADFDGTVTLKYTVADVNGHVSNEATVTIRVATHPWQNTDPGDVNDIGGITNLDAFLLVAELRANSAHALTLPYTGTGPITYFDPTGDDNITNLDAFFVIGLLRAAAGEGVGAGEGEGVAASESLTNEATPVADVNSLNVASESALSITTFSPAANATPAELVAGQSTAAEDIGDDLLYAAALASVADESSALLPADLAAELARALVR